MSQPLKANSLAIRVSADNQLIAEKTSLQSK